jgi:hypothetical protein
MATPYVMIFTPTGGQPEYLESVSRDGNTTWTTNPDMAIQFLSEQMVPATTVLLRFPFIEPPKKNATQSQVNLYHNVMKWLQEHNSPFTK